jgi:hypothetical protein
LRRNDLEVIQRKNATLVTPPFSDRENRRLASPLKLKVVRLDNQLRLLITAPREDIITTAQTALRTHRSKPETWARI